MDEETASLLRMFSPYANTKGESARNPFVVVALLLSRTLGDFVDQSLFAASFAKLFQHAHLHVYYRDDRPYKQDVVSMIPNLKEAWGVRGDNSLPLDAFDGVFEPPVKVASGEWYENKCESADIILTPQMMNRAALPMFPSLEFLRIPSNKMDALDARLKKLGVDPNRWFCVLHYREPSYGFRPVEKDRDFAPDEAVAMTRHVIEHLGGQVVRVGHKEMVPFPEMDGFVDLATEEDAFLLQAYATSRSRFFLELSTSGAVCIAWAMGVPVLRCNCVSIVGPLDSNSIVLTKHIIRPDGSRMSMREMVDGKVISDVAMKKVLQPQGFQYESNSLAELKAATWKIFSVTADCSGWRSPATVKPHAPTNRVELPLARGYQHIIADHDTGDSDP